MLIQLCVRQGIFELEKTSSESFIFMLAAGLSPAWQQIVVLDSLREGEVNRAREVHWCASGKVLNVGLALHRLSAGDESLRAKTLSLIGGAGGTAIEEEFKQLGASTHWIHSIAPTRVCTTLIDQSSKRTTEIVENARPVPPEELETYRAAFVAEAAQAKFIVLTGSLPAGAPASFLADLLPLTTAKVILDFRGEALLNALPHRPFLVKPNREELGLTFNTPLTSDGDLLAAMRDLNDRGAEHVLVTQGSDRVWLTSASDTFFAEPPQVAVVNPIGCGDCLAAGLTWSLAAGHDIPTALTHGIAAAALNAQDLLPSRFIAEQVRQLARQIKVQRA